MIRVIFTYFTANVPKVESMSCSLALLLSDKNGRLKNQFSFLEKTYSVSWQKIFCEKAS